LMASILDRRPTASAPGGRETVQVDAGLGDAGGLGTSASSTDAPECREWVGHVIVCGLNDVALRTVEQLHLAGARVVVLSDETSDRLVRIVRGLGVGHLPPGGPPS